MIKWSKFASKATKLGKKAKGLKRKTKTVAKSYINYAKQYPELTATTVGVGGLVGLGVGSAIGALGEDPKSYNYKNKRVNQRTLERAKKVKMYG